MDSIHQTSPPRPNSDGSSGYGSYHSLDKLDDDESDVKDDTEDDKKDNKYKTRGNEGPKNIALRALLVISVLLNIVLLCFIFAFILYVKLFSEDDNDNKQWNTVNSNSYALADNCYQLSTAENHKTKTEDHPLTKHSSSAFCQYSATKYLHNLLVLMIHESRRNHTQSTDVLFTMRLPMAAYDNGQSLLWSKSRIQLQIGSVDVVKDHEVFSLSFRQSGFYHICISILFSVPNGDEYEIFGVELLRHSTHDGDIDVLLSSILSKRSVSYYTMVLQDIIYLESGDSLALHLAGIHAVNFNYHANYFMAYKLP